MKGEPAVTHCTDAIILLDGLDFVICLFGQIYSINAKICQELNGSKFYVLCIFQKLEQIVILIVDKVIVHQSCHWNQLVLLTLQFWIGNEIIMNSKDMVHINFLLC